MMRDDPPDLLLRRSDTGHHVLVEPVSQTVVVDESWERAHARMLEILAATPAPARAPARGSFEFRGRAALWALGAAIVAPLLWLMAMERRLSVLEEVAAAEPPPAREEVNSGAAPPEEPLPPLRGKPARRGKRPGAGRPTGEPRPAAPRGVIGRGPPDASDEAVKDATAEASADGDDE